MKSIKCFLVLLLLALRSFSVVDSVFAESDDFFIDSQITYDFSDDGTSKVTHNITIENKKTDRLAQKYTLHLSEVVPLNPHAYQDNTELPLETVYTNNGIDIKITFPDKIVGQGSFRNFEIYYTDQNRAKIIGDIWEIQIPKVDSTSFSSFDATLLIPKSFGPENYIFPKPKSTQVLASKFKYTFNQDELLENGVSVSFGEFQVFKFDISYHLENPISKKATQQIALPPDTSYQRIILKDLNPKPDKLYVDLEGNWIAEYSLNSRQKLDINTNGYVQIFSSPRTLQNSSDDYLNKTLLPDEFWQVNDPKIRQIANTLKTPKKIYNYVIKTLNYDFGRAKPISSRKGALLALDNPNNSICLEFTDLFITLARAAGIPAREIVGFAYTKNKTLKPLSLVSDVLHSWPEYYDKDKNLWTPIDPTWADTTGGADYFHKFDLKHFTFVIHGLSSDKPTPPGSYKLGSEPQKDIIIKLAEPPPIQYSEPVLAINPKSKIPFRTSDFEITVTNPGPTALYNQKLEIYKGPDLYKTINLPSLLPFQKHNIPLSIKIGFLGRNTPHIIKVKLQDDEVYKSTNKDIAASIHLIAIFLGVIFTIFLSILTLRGLKKG